MLLIWLLCVYLTNREEKSNISSSSVDGGARVWVGKDFLEKRSKIFLLLLLMDKLVSGWAKIF